jgi:hypothetical protein
MYENSENEDKDPLPQLQKHKEVSSQFEIAATLLPSPTSGSCCMRGNAGPRAILGVVKRRQLPISLLNSPFNTNLCFTQLWTITFEVRISLNYTVITIRKEIIMTKF